MRDTTCWRCGGVGLKNVTHVCVTTTNQTGGYPPMYPSVQSPALSGWVCPRCNAVMSPSVSVCLYCKPTPSATTSDRSGRNPSPSPESGAGVQR